MEEEFFKVTTQPPFGGAFIKGKKMYKMTLTIQGLVAPYKVTHEYDTLDECIVLAENMFCGDARMKIIIKGDDIHIRRDYIGAKWENVPKLRTNLRNKIESILKDESDKDENFRFGRYSPYLKLNTSKEKL